MCIKARYPYTNVADRRWRIFQQPVILCTDVSMVICQQQQWCLLNHFKKSCLISETPSKKKPVYYQKIVYRAASTPHIINAPAVNDGDSLNILVSISSPLLFIPRFISIILIMYMPIIQMRNTKPILFSILLKIYK